MADSKIGILIAAKDAASAEIKKVSGNLKEIDGAASIAAGGISGLATAMGVLGAIKLGSMALDLAGSAAQADRTRTAFDNLAKGVGQSGDAMLSAMQEASKGQISNANLVLAANRAMLLGVADSSAELAQLLDVARVRGQAMGLSVTDAFQDLVTGLGRMSPLILDNLGIVTGGEKVFSDYAASIGRTAESLTDAEKKQALLNKVISETQPLIDASAGSGDDAAGSFERMAASVENAKNALGELLLALDVTGLVDVLAAGLEKDREDVEKLAAAANELKAAFSGMQVTDAQNVLSDIGPQIAAAAAEFNTALTDFQNAATAGGAAAGNLQPLSLRLQALSGQLQDLAADYNAAAAVTGAPLIDTAQLQAGIVAFQETAVALEEVATAGPHAARGIDDASTAALGGIRNLRAMARAARELAIEFDNTLSVTGKARFEQELGDAAASDRALGLIRQRREEEVRAAEAAGRAWQSEMDDAAREVERRFNDLKGKVAGVLSGARTDIAGVDVDALLPREDAVNENARRLADIAVNGFKNQPWMEEFKREVPEAFKEVAESADPKGTAARMLKEFQDGLQPELIDKEKAKDLVRKMIFGEQQADQLATEIAQELAAEFGTAAPANLNELVGQALGTGGKGAGATGGAQAGADAASSFAQSFTSAAAGVGAQIAASLKVDSVIALIKDAGKAAGETWGNMFLSVVGDNVPETLVSLLTDLVTPAVQARLATQTSLTAAK